MFDMSWGEVLVIGAVALIVIGPKDLPKALRTLGQMTTKVRRMAGEFQTQFNDAMREAELDDVKKQLQGMNDQVSAFNPIQTVRDELRGAIESKPNSESKPNTDPPPTYEPSDYDTLPASAALPAPQPEIPTPVPAPAAIVEPAPPAEPVRPLPANDTHASEPTPAGTAKA